MITSTDIAHQVATAIEAGDHADTIDQDAIVRDIIAEHGRVDIDTIDPDTFWAIVARHDSSQGMTGATITGLSTEQAQYVIDSSDANHARVSDDGTEVVIDEQGLAMLAALGSDCDGHFDGRYVWIGGSEYTVRGL